MDRDERNAHLDTVLIVGREQRELVPAEYDPQWPERFEQERARIAGVADPDDEPSFVPALEGAGYTLRVREPGHRMFRTPARDVHVHIWSYSGPEARRQLNHYAEAKDAAERGDPQARPLAEILVAGPWPSPPACSR